ncbi:branched-chain amino acid ABC transporter permease [Aeromicrobium sp.]|uniref:branched-chain amino acid ABC transporter permease n=1 Tax=Aeromicrobium sp. TaxID=1871063 RepID=UPI003D6B197C
MTTFLQLTVNGAGRGAVYALLALGFVIIFRATGVVNFAHGSFVFLGGYVTYVASDSLGFAGAAALGVATAAIGALLIERFLIARTRLADPISLALLTIGVDVIITEDIARRLGTETPFLSPPFAGDVVRIGDVTILSGQLVAIAVSAVLIGTLLLAFRYTGWGLSMRAQAENREAASLMGIRNSQVTASAWVVAGALAGIAVLFLATQDFSGAGLSRGTHALALVAFPAAIIGGLDSVGGAVFGGLVVGLTEAYAAQYISFDFSKSAVYLVMLVILVAVPSGLFGSKDVNRV